MYFSGDGDVNNVAWRKASMSAAVNNVGGQYVIRKVTMMLACVSVFSNNGGVMV